MVLIKVQYDAYNRQFKLLDCELARALDDGEIYMVLADVSFEDLNLTSVSGSGSLAKYDPLGPSIMLTR